MNTFTYNFSSLSEGQKAAFASFTQSVVTYPFDTGIKKNQAGLPLKHLFNYRGFPCSSVNYCISRYIGFEIMNQFRSNSEQNKMVSTMYGAAANAIIKPFIIYPLDTVKIQFQTEAGRTYKRIFNNIKAIPKEKHLLAIQFLQIRTIIGYSTWFLSQDAYKELISKSNTIEHRSLSGMISGLSLAIALQPFDIGKVINQTGNHTSLTKLYIKHGLKRFYSPSLFGLTLIKQITNSFIFSNVYGLLKSTP